MANEIYHTYRSSFRLQYRFGFKDIVVLDGSNFQQSLFTRKGDYIIRSANKLGIKLRKWTSLTTVLDDNKMNITNTENLNLSYGISIDQYF